MSFERLAAVLIVLLLANVIAWFNERLRAKREGRGEKSNEPETIVIGPDDSPSALQCAMCHFEEGCSMDNLDHDCHYDDGCKAPVGVERFSRRVP